MACTRASKGEHGLAVQPDPPALLREAQWLDQLALLAELPYAMQVLLPTLLQLLRRGVHADFGTFTEIDPRSLASGAIYSERFSPSVMKWLCASRDEAQAQQSTEAMVRSDGESRRLMCARPDYTDNPLFEQIYKPLAARWTTTLPLTDARGGAHGLMYLHRSAAQGAFSDEEQHRLRRARRTLTALTAPRRASEPNAVAASHVLASQALLVVGADGHLVSAGERAIDLLYASAVPTAGNTRWAECSVQALPPPLLEQALRLLHAKGQQAHAAPCVVRGLGGDYAFRLERIHGLHPPSTMVAVHIQHLEPADLTLTRELANWALSRQEKRILIATLTTPDQYALAERLGITLNTLKGHVKGMLHRTGAASRQALVQRILAHAQQSSSPRLH